MIQHELQNNKKEKSTGSKLIKEKKLGHKNDINNQLYYQNLELSQDMRVLITNYLKVMYATLYTTL